MALELLVNYSQTQDLSKLNNWGADIHISVFCTYISVEFDCFYGV